MDSIFQAGIAFIIWFQSLAGWLKTPMLGFTFLGSEEFFLLFLPIIYWCVDTNLGIRMGAILLLNGGLNHILKLAFHGPRPYWISPQVKALSSEVSFGFPSFHAQTAAGLWGLLAVQIKRFWAWASAIFIVLMIGLSRLYLGVHFPHDVIFGWVLGALVLWIFSHWWEVAVAWAQRKALGQQIVLAFLLSALVLVIGAIAFGPLRQWEIPVEWVANARAVGAQELPAPTTLNSVILSAATFFGLLAGLAWTRSRGGFDPGGPVAQRIIRFVVGLVGVLILWKGLDLIFPRGEALLPYILRYLRYALVGGWVSAGGPWLFIRLKLASKSATNK
jgi:membrane-associated phospholipid phosphatase